MYSVCADNSLVTSVIVWTYKTGIYEFSTYMYLIVCKYMDKQSLELEPS